MRRRIWAVLATAALSTVGLACDGDPDTNRSPLASESPERRQAAEADAAQAEQAAKKAEARATRRRLGDVEPR